MLKIDKEDIWKTVYYLLVSEGAVTYETAYIRVLEFEFKCCSSIGVDHVADPLKKFTHITVRLKHS